MSRLVRALDASAYTGEIASSIWPALRSSGISVFVPQIWGGPSGPNPYLAQHVQGARAAGLAIAGGYCWPPSRWADALDHWRAQLGDLPRVMWLDVEAGTGFDKGMVSGLAHAGVQAGIYCSPWTWQSIMGNTTAFLNLPTWLATYVPGDWPTSLPALAFPYGRVVGWQWQGTTTLLDEQYDLNVFDADWLASLEPRPPEQEDDMPLLIIRDVPQGGALLIPGALSLMGEDTVTKLKAQGAVEVVDAVLFAALIEGRRHDIKEGAQAALNAWWNEANVQKIVEKGVAAQLPAFITAVPSAQVNIDAGAFAKALAADLVKRLET